MKTANDCSRNSIVAIVTLALACGVGTVHADFTISTPTELGPPIWYPGDDPQGCCFSRDGLELYFSSNRPGGYGGPFDLWVSTRETVDAPWTEPVNLGPNVNGSAGEVYPAISPDGLELYFNLYYDRPRRILRCSRSSKDAPWSKPEVVFPSMGASDTWTPEVSADGLSLYMTSGQGEASDISVATRTTMEDNWGTPVDLGPSVNSPHAEGTPSISSDGLVLFFMSDRPGGYGAEDIWVTTRSTTDAEWGPPVNYPSLNQARGDWDPAISPDGSVLYFESIFTRWQSSITPILDFNGDGKVDERDMALLVADWGKNNSVCDIGPYPWGDGIVDTYDLSVPLKEMTGSGIALHPRSDASEVTCDAILSWTSVSFAQSYDVYLGTSQEAVNVASRANPQGVLVSQGHTATTYDPEGLLDFSQTYYWRVDFVTPGPAPIIYQGPVLEFTTAALTYQIKNITATASSAQAGSGPERTVDGSGLDKNGGHSTDPKDMWWSQGTPPHWIQYEFDKIYALHEMWVWNMNQMIEPFIGFGAKTVNIEYSADGATWTALANVPEFAKAPGKAGYTANTIVSFAAVPARFVKLTIEKNWSAAAPQTGLSEVRFFCIQSAAVPQP